MPRFPDATSTNVADSIRQARLYRRLTQCQLAEMTGMKQAAISRIESGQYMPNMSTLHRLAAAMNMKMGVYITPVD